MIDDTVRLEGLAYLVDPNPTTYVERYRPPVPPAAPRHNLRAGGCEALAARTVFPSLTETCPVCEP